jgi:hypothetical protein
MKTTMKISALAALAVTLILAMSYMAEAKEIEISKQDLPKEVLAAFNNIYPHAAIKGISKEIADGQTIYEIESADGKIRRDVSLKADGQIIEVEEVVNVLNLPEQVTKAIHDNYPNGKIEKAEKLTKDLRTSFEVVVEKGKENYKVVLDVNGKILKSEQIKENEEKEESEK